MNCWGSSSGHTSALLPGGIYKNTEAGQGLQRPAVTVTSNVNIFDLINHPG